MTSLNLLPEIAQAVGGRCKIYMDSGIRQGADVLKALALGARAVFIGRPFIWGLVINGTDGIVSVLNLLGTELEQAIALVGCSTLASINRSFIRIRTV